MFFRGLAEMLSVKATLVAGTPAELAQKLLAKEIDAFWYGSGIPSPPFVEIADKAEAVVFGLAPTRLRRCAGSSPISYLYEIAAGTYRGTDRRPVVARGVELRRRP